MVGLMVLRVAAIRNEAELERLYQTITVDVSVSGGGGYGTNDSASDEGEDRPSGGYGTSDERG